MKLSGARILMESLKREKVKMIFGYPGGAVLPIFDELYSSGLPFVLVRHEQAAAHAADGFARASGKVGVCLATSGPGATNLVTGIATAYMDSIPMVAIVGQVKTSLIGNDAFQEVYTIGITNPITKHNYLVTDICDLSRVVREAFYIARTGRPGPVVIDLPVDITKQEAEYDHIPKMRLPGYHPLVKVSMEELRPIVKAIHCSKKPLFYIGGGVILSNASADFTKLARKFGIPVTTTLNGLGAFPSTDPLSLGMLGMHGTVCANLAVQNCDLLISIGARFDDRVTGKLDEFAPHATIVHIDIDPSSISKNVKVHLPCVGDAKCVIRKMMTHAKKLHIPKWISQVLLWKEKFPLRYAQSECIKPQYVLERIWHKVNGHSLIVTDVGQHQMWTAQWIKFTQPRTFLSSGGLGTMGFGLPAAMGAKLAKKHKQVILITGDGSILMNIQELATIRAYNIPVKILIFNNGYLGMVRQWQELFFEKRYSQTDLGPLNPDFVSVSHGFGIPARMVEKKEDLDFALCEALLSKTPYVLDIHIDREENVYPMVPAGQAIDRMIGGMA